MCCGNDGGDDGDENDHDDNNNDDAAFVGVRYPPKKEMTFEMLTSCGIDDHLTPAFQNKKIVNPIKHLSLTAV